MSSERNPKHVCFTHMGMHVCLPPIAAQHYLIDWLPDPQRFMAWQIGCWRGTWIMQKTQSTRQSCVAILGYIIWDIQYRAWQLYCGSCTVVLFGNHLCVHLNSHFYSYIDAVFYDIVVRVSSICLQFFVFVFLFHRLRRRTLHLCHKQDEESGRALIGCAGVDVLR